MCLIKFVIKSVHGHANGKAIYAVELSKYIVSNYAIYYKMPMLNANLAHKKWCLYIYI